jgi:uncharacterized protein (TIGR02588 family)
MIVLLALLGLLTYRQWMAGARPAAIEVQPRLDLVRREAGGYYVPVEVANRGSGAARGVQVRVSLADERGERETADLLIEYLTGEAAVRGTVVFRQDPTQGIVTARVVAFLPP